MPTETGTDPAVQADIAATDSRARRVRVVQVIDETAAARSFVVEPDPRDVPSFDYRPGQFLTVRVPDTGRGSGRCYSLSSSPHTDIPLKFTVKRVEGGHGSTWLCIRCRWAMSSRCYRRRVRSPRIRSTTRWFGSPAVVGSLP